MSVANKPQAIHVQRRIEVVIALMALGLAMLLIRAVDLHILQGDALKTKASHQHFHQYDVAAPRGNILDRQGRILSKSIEVPSIGVLVEEVPQKDLASLAKALEMPLAKLQKKIKNRKGFTWLTRQTSPTIAARVAALNIPGVRQEREWRRYHPLGPETGHVLGFVGIDGHGLEGIERSMDKRLQGQVGTRLVQRDARGHSLPGGIWLKKPRMGDSLQLTIDSNIQSIAYAALTEGVHKQHAKGGSVVVMNPKNGDVLAMASWPGFNPNNFTRYKPGQWRNRAITDMFEPGSTMKPFTIATAIESTKWQAKNLVFCENGSFKVADYTIHDDHSEGWLDLTGIIAKSSNIGAAKIALNIGPKQLGSHLSSLGFGQRTGIGLGGESSGILSPPDKWGVVETANIAFGQGIATTPLQLAAAFSVLANDGVKLAPRLILSDEEPHGTQIFSPKTTQTLTKMLIAATSSGGTGQKAVPVGYLVAGKTGTAQKANKHGSYAKDKYTAVFAGFAPAEDPKVVIVVVIDEPKKSIYGGTVAAPIFRNIAATTLPYIGSPPQLKASEEWKVRHVSSTPNDTFTSGLTPHLQGLSLRQALHRTEQQGYALHSHGSGWVSRQSPRALTALPAGSDIEVWLNE